MKQTDLYHHYDKIANHQSNDFRISSIINLILPYLEYGKLILDAGCGSCAELVPLLSDELYLPNVKEEGKVVIDSSCNSLSLW